jgi:hypothetical protein
VLRGSELRAEAKGGRIHISLGAKGSWEYPNLEIGLRSIGDLLEGNIGAVETIEGECTGSDPIDQELLNGTFLVDSAFGTKVKICWIRTLPAQGDGSRLIRLAFNGWHRLSMSGPNDVVRLR